MKKMLLMAAMAVATLSANAQTWIGGSLGFDYEKFKGSKDSKTSFTITPTIGYNLDANWALGLQLNFGVTNDGNTNLAHNDKKTTSFTVAPFARYTFAQFGNASLFVDGGFGVGYEEVNKIDNTTWNVGFRPGMSVAFNEHLSAVATMGYLGYRHTDGYNHIGLNADGNALSFGLYYTF